MYNLPHEPDTVEFRNVYEGSIDIKDKSYEYTYIHSNDEKSWEFKPEDENTSYLEGILIDAIEDPIFSLSELLDQLNNEIK